MIAFADAGITTFDCADIYTGVEELIGALPPALPRPARRRRRWTRIRVHTKFVPDLDVLPRITKAYVEGVIDQLAAAARHRAARPRAVPLVGLCRRRAGSKRRSWLDELRRAGKIDKIGAHQFRHASTCSAIVEAGVPLVSMQVQYSLLDSRPDKRMVAAAARARRRAALLRHGGRRLPRRPLARRSRSRATPLENRSLTKYKLIIDDFGGWDLFQALLRTLRGIADRHGTDIATVASAAMLTRPGVAGGHRRRAQPLASRRQPRDLRPRARRRTTTRRSTPCWRRRSELDGDVYTLERDRTGRHGSIMKYNLNKGAA